jgi:hypothetical protein
MARVLVTCALAACVATLGGIYAAPAHAQTFRSDAAPMLGIGAATVPSASYEPGTEPRHASSNFLRPHYGSFECATDDGREYRWPCSRPGAHH